MFKTLLNSRKIITEKPCQGITKRVLELFEISDTRTTLCRNIPTDRRTNTVASAPALTDLVLCGYSDNFVTK